jgi:type VII secretion protein EccB
MPSRHEQVRAHRFVTRRIVSAMLSGEPESTELPARRLAMALFGSLIVATIVFAIVGVIGFINPTGGKPEENDIIIMRETGARYIYVDGALHPVLNYASALLIVGSPNPQVRTMSRKSLQKLPGGLPVGIRDAPDPPPAADALLGLPWSVCSSPPATTSGVISTQVVVGNVPAGGTALGDQALLVSTAQSGSDLPMYLLWNDHRLRINDATTLTALELASTTPVRIGGQLLNSITAGPDLAPLELSGQGQTSAKVVAGRPGKIGQVYRSGQTNYVLTGSGLVAIGTVMAALLTADGGAPTDITAGEAAQALSTEKKVEPDGFPQTRPPLRNVTSPQVCAAFQAAAAGRQPVTIQVYDDAAPSKDSDSGAVSQDGALTADHILVPEGHGALVRALPAPGVTAATTVYLVTDQGLAFPLQDGANVNTQAALGYAGKTPTPIPSPLLALVPLGPTLNPATARSFAANKPAPVNPPAPTTTAPTNSPSPTTSKRRRRSGGVDLVGGDPVP